MGEAIGSVLPLGVGVALSPLPIIAVVLMLATPRGRTNGIAFIVGWVLGLAAAGAIVLLISGGASAATRGQPATWVSVVKIVLGAGMLLLAAHQWRSRPRRGEQPQLPGWMTTIDRFGPSQSAMLAIGLSAVNPKNLLLVVAAAAGIAQTGISADGQAVALTVFVVLGTVGPAAPLVIYLALGARSANLLDTLRQWMATHNSAIMTVLLLVIGAKLIGDGITTLS